ncbi:hypothetical protein D3C75_1041350 [compost metagenome]
MISRLRAQTHRVETSEEVMLLRLNTTSLTTASNAESTCSMRVDREPSCKASKNSSGSSRWLFIQRSHAAWARFRCSQRNCSASCGCCRYCKALAESISWPRSPGRKLKP